FHGFYFRSVFFPIVCVVVSVYISAGRVQIMAARWGVAVIALLFSSLTMFYHFEFVENICSPVRFGLVDNFQAGIAAIASATFIRSLATSSVRVLFVGIIMASFTVLIKPSGGAVMALLGMSWVVFVSLEWFHFRHCLEISKKLRRYLVLGSMQLFAVYLVITVVCVKSQYLSSENFLFAKQALVIMKDELAIDFSQIPLLLHVSMGEAIFFWIIGVIVLFVFICYSSRDLSKRIFFKMSGFLVLAFIFWAGGMFFWLVVQAGGNQMRYFHPFFLMGLICLVPLAVYVWSRSDKWIRLVLVLICILPAGNMAFLLMQKHPSLSWQKATGVSLLVGTNDEVVKQAYSFLETVQQRKFNAMIYSFSTELPVAIFESVGMYEGVVNPNSPTFSILRPVDWVRGFVIRVDDLLSSDYICFEPLKDDEFYVAMELKQIQSFKDENRVFRAWLSMLTVKDGIEIVSDGSVRLLEITDLTLFEYLIEQFISSRTWRSEFKEANPRRWWSDSEVSSYILSNKSVAKEIEFGDLYRLHVMTISCLGEKIKIEFWWEALRDDDKSWERRMFFHFIDSEAKIRSQQSVSLDGYKPPSPQRRWRYGAVEFDPSIDAEISALAFGVWHPDRKVGLLTADKGVRDWNDRRVLIPLNVERPVK
ncbi:MAG: hypothetical protein KAI69_00785, partial [Deltaproteobacteria bacterium]|nr:hypothetical protein [Deltaproteobacteria bacterium]